MTRDGLAVALAWPDTKCRQAGAWYDKILTIFGLNVNGYYRVGHAALLLVNKQSGECYYFDFGRYHAPFGHGRVRNATTDHDLVVRTKATIVGNKIINFEDILFELQGNKSCHGDGTLYASYTPVSFQAAYAKAIQMQQLSPWVYGPLVWSGTNCSRFVRKVILAGKPVFRRAALLALPPMLSPSPRWNVRALRNRHKLKPVVNSQIKLSAA